MSLKEAVKKLSTNRESKAGQVANSSPFCVKLNADQLIQYDKQESRDGFDAKSIDCPLNSRFTYPSYGSNKQNNGADGDDDPVPNEVVNVASIIGNIGWFQLLVLVFSGLRECTVGYDALITSVMLQPEHNFVCTTSQDLDDPGDTIVGSRRHARAITFNSELNSTDTAACTYNDPGSNSSLPCTSWAFPERDLLKASLVVEWQLVCSRGFYTALIESSFFLGLVLGNIIWGYLADRIGRKKAYILSHVIALIAGSLSLIAPDVRIFIVLRFLAAIGSIGYNIIYTIQMELIGTQHRSYATMFNHLGWGMGAISIPLMASMTSNTRIMLSVTPLIALFMLPWAFWLPESSRWLMARGKFSQARKELIRAAKFNGKQIDAKLENLICSLNDKIVQDKAKQKSKDRELARQRAAQADDINSYKSCSTTTTMSTSTNNIHSDDNHSTYNNHDNLSNYTQSPKLRSTLTTTTTAVAAASPTALNGLGSNSDEVIIIHDITDNPNYHGTDRELSHKLDYTADNLNTRSNSIISSQSSNASSNISTYRILCSNPKLVRDTFIIAYCSFSGHLFYYLQTINFGEMKNLSIEANFISSGAGEWVSLVVGALALKCLSRRTCMSICLFLMASSFIFQSMIDSELMSELDTKVIVTLNNTVGTVASLLLIFVVLIVNQEVYPTIIRQSGSSIGNTLGELGSTLAPWLIQLNHSIGLWRADILCAVMCLTGMVGSQFLTKTDNVELEDI